MPRTYEPIATNTVSGTTTSVVTFSSIPSTYTDLVLVANGKSTSSPGTGAYFVRFNSDSGNNYSRTRILGNGTAASSFRASGESAIASDGINSEWGVSIFNIMNYANTTTNKTMLFRDNTTAYVTAQVGLWRSTAAINTVSLTADQGYYLSGSTFTLYGIRAA